MDLEMELHNADSSSFAAKKKRKKRNSEPNALCKSNGSSNDCPEGASLIQDIPLERNSYAESAVDISSNSGLIEVQSNSSLMCSQNEKKTKWQQKEKNVSAPKTGNINVDSSHDCPDGASLMQDVPLDRNSCAESSVDICSNSALIEAHYNSNLMCSQKKGKRKKQRKKKKHNAPKPDSTDVDLQAVGAKTMVAPFRTESSVDTIIKIVPKNASLEPLGDTSSKMELAAAPVEMNASVNTSTKMRCIKKLSRSKKKRIRKRLKESRILLEKDDKDHVLSGDNSLIKNIFPEKDSSLQSSVDICSKNESEMRQPNGDICLSNGHNVSENNRVINLPIANGKHLEKEDVKLAPKVAELDLTTVKEDFLMSEKQSCSKSANKSLVEKHEVQAENSLVSSETMNTSTSKRNTVVKTYIRKKRKRFSNSMVNSLDCIEGEGTRHTSGDILMKNVSVLPEGHLEQKDKDKQDDIQIALQDVSHGDGICNESPSYPREDNISGHAACCKNPEKNYEEVFPSSHLGVMKVDSVLDGTGKKENLPQPLQPSPERVCIGHSKKKLLVLDVNGLLADIVSQPSHRKPDIMVSKKAGENHIYNYFLFHI